MAFQALLVEEFGSVNLAKDFGIILFIPACKHKKLNRYKKIIQQATDLKFTIRATAVLLIFQAGTRQLQRNSYTKYQT